MSNSWSTRVETGIRKYVREADNGEPTTYYGVSANVKIDGKQVKTRYFDTLEEARMFRKLISNAKKIRNFKDVESTFVDKKMWPHNLLNAMYITVDRFPETYDEIADNFEERFNSMQALTDRELRVIIASYKEYLTLEEIGKEFGISGNRVQQIRAKALRKLIAPKNRRIFVETKEKMEVLNAEETKKIREEIESKLTLEASLEIVAKEFCFEDTNELCEWLKKHGGVIKGTTLTKESSIKELELHIRAYNCLLRGDIKTIGDLLERNVEDLQRIRNMGRKSVKEIIDALNKYDLHIRGEVEFLKSIKKIA